ncbi:MAG: Smr/MutS family protein [Acidobacteriota bacterium]
MTEEIEDLEPVELPLEDSIDLHPFRPRDVKEVVLAYLEEALEAGFVEVRIIHGRGVGTQREIVRKVLERHEQVVSFSDAPAERGGWGATIARLAHGGRIEL